MVPFRYGSGTALPAKVPGAGEPRQSTADVAGPG
ncbi:MAG: hypothetical protein JWO79_1909 [Actinomycetia bacterium]|jgi:hypothetical protein|nr:hypothetical protein [Actinomycetes bacterium]MDQ1651975.1 hypothetical protein [Cryptosporangiaceae bacterium]MDQ1656375.1 hypothetical protein [Cryptosporangiaceae bacterium]